MTSSFHINSKWLTISKELYVVRRCAKKKQKSLNTRVRARRDYTLTPSFISKPNKRKTSCSPSLTMPILIQLLRTFFYDRSLSGEMYYIPLPSFLHSDWLALCWISISLKLILIQNNQTFIEGSKLFFPSC